MDVRFQVCFTPLTAVLFAFPSRYWFTIGHHGVFSLGEWSPRIQTGFHVSRPTWDTDRLNCGFRLRGYHPLWPFFPERSAIQVDATSRSRNPGKQAFRFGLVRVRSPLLAQSRLLSSPCEWLCLLCRSIEKAKLFLKIENSFYRLIKSFH